MLKHWGAVLGLFCTISLVQAQGLDDGWIVSGCSLMSGASFESTRYFRSGVTYTIMANGAEGAMDVDLYVLDRTGREIASDTSYRREATVSFRPTVSGNYTVRVKLASGVGKPVCFFMVFVNRGGWIISEQTIGDTLLNFTVACSVYTNGEMERFYGWIMRPGETQSLNVSGLNGEYDVIGSGSEQAYDIDLFIRSGGGIVLDRDVLDDAVPVCSFSRYSGSVTIEVSYVDGRGAALVLVGVFKKPGSFYRL